MEYFNAILIRSKMFSTESTIVSDGFKGGKKVSGVKSKQLPCVIFYIYVYIK